MRWYCCPQSDRERLKCIALLGSMNSTYLLILRQIFASGVVTKYKKWLFHMFFICGVVMCAICFAPTSCGTQW